MAGKAKGMDVGARSLCPIATTLDIVGDRWTLVILRDLMTGKTRYSQLLESPERITTNILASRLEAMQVAGLIEKKPYQQRPLRHDYHLTAMGWSLHPVLLAICDWANGQFSDCWVAPQQFRDLASKLN